MNSFQSLMLSLLTVAGVEVVTFVAVVSVAEPVSTVDVVITGFGFSGSTGFFRAVSILVLRSSVLRTTELESFFNLPPKSASFKDCEFDFSPVIIVSRRKIFFIDKLFLNH